MISTRDEIMIILAEALNKMGIEVPIPPIPVFDKPEEPREIEKDVETEEEEEKPLLPIPIPAQPQGVQPSPLPMPLPTSVQQKDPFARDPESVEAWTESDVGTAAWVAEHHPYSYLFGHKPFLKFTGNPENDPITQGLMEKIVTQEPEKYFEWGLYRIKHDLERLGTDWGIRAAKALVEKDPYAAIILGIYDNDYIIQRDPEILPTLWSKILDSEYNRSSKTETGNIFPGVLFSRMRGLAKMLKEYHPDFYETYLADNALAQRIERGKEFYTKETRRSPISHRERGFPWAEPEPGTSEWIAEHYPHTYLRGQDTMSKGYVREFQDPAIIKSLMDKLVQENPIKYFEWNLRRVGDKGGRINLKDWLVPAATSLMDKNPYAALVFARIYQNRETERLLPELWDKLMVLERDEPHEGEIKRHMRSMAGVLARSHPEFYDRKIKGTEYSTEEFDARARQALGII